MTKEFEQLEIWRAAFDLAHAVRMALKPRGCLVDGDMRNQMRRAAVSIPSNIAEGYEKGSARDSMRFYRIAKGSSGELRTQLRLCQRAGELPNDLCEELIAGCMMISRCLGGFIRYLEKRERGGESTEGDTN
jgi:four helix bundle protein